MVNFHRLPFVILSVVVLVIAGSLTYFYTIWSEPPGPEYGWGGNSPMGINLTLAKTNITINETLEYTITLKNTGPESIRVYIDSYIPHIRINDLLGPPVANFSVVSSRDPLSDPARFNRHLTVLGPGEDVTVTGAIVRGSQSFGGWDIHPNGTYEVFGWYYFRERPAYPALPCWRGDIYTKRIQFSVLP